MSGDGRNNCGEYPQPVRDRAVSIGVTINGLANSNEDPYLMGLLSAFGHRRAGRLRDGRRDFTSFAEAIRLKLLRELAPGPTAVLGAI